MNAPFSFIKYGIRALLSPLFALRRQVRPQVEYIPVSIADLPPAFDGVRIGVVSDVHLPDNAVSPADILAILGAEKPDYIFIAGDMLNRYGKLDDATLTDFLTKVAAIAPTIAVAGNHEYKSNRLTDYGNMLDAANIQYLRDSYTILHKDEDTLWVYGVCDITTTPPAPSDTPAILLSHHPEYAAHHSAAGYALAVCGHAHGGQIMLGKRGLFAPGQGFFAKFVSGLYHVSGMQMVVSRGLGDSSLPIRIRNLPHLPIIQLTAAEHIL